jgi:hypothetical protein
MGGNRMGVGCGVGCRVGMVGCDCKEVGQHWVVMQNTTRMIRIDFGLKIANTALFVSQSAKNARWQTGRAFFI